MPESQFHISRRRFLKSASALAGAAAVPAWYLEHSAAFAATPPPLSPNDKPGVALIGCGGQGRWIAKQAQDYANIVAVCDVDQTRAESASKQFGDARIYKDYRKLLERDDIHAVMNGTPDHWHTFINIAAMKAGRDVYSEKPLTLTIEEGIRLVRVARETGRILQTGSQQRSEARFRLACELVRNGRLGALKHVVTALPAGPRGGPFKPSPVPAGIDWDFWQGQTPDTPYIRERCHGSFRYWWEYSGGTMTDWGAHHNDIALWGLGLERSGPVSVEGRPLVQMISGGYTAASEYEVNYTYANGVTHKCRSTRENKPDGSQTGQADPDSMPHGIRFEGTNGWIFVTRGKIEASDSALLSEPLTHRKVELYESHQHVGNFFDCVRSRKAPICDAEIGHRSVSVCHLGVIAMRLGRKLQWDPDKEQFVGDAEANRWIGRPQRKPWTYDLA